MHTLVKNLKNLSNQIMLAKKQNDYNKIIGIDNDCLLYTSDAADE